MYFKRRCKITFLCHGATIYSEEGRFSDALNYPPLSDLGVEETENIVKYLRDRAIKNDAIYSSPALRTKQSADMIAGFFKQDYEVVDELTPRKCGSWNGKTYEQILAKFPDGLTDALINPDEEKALGGETNQDFIKRIKTVIDGLVERNIGNRIIIVTHPDVIQAAICGALEIPGDKLFKIYVRTGSATQISYFEKWSSLVYCDHVPL
ncbi:MAG: histidine phosphatase family protein [Cyanobacteriota bacterium]|nr:histidine phosphatase family protein [Cyanobacteriota bacterium]MDY6358006.1 histidine phosphatase family protein [Cyanobacteriota bacterium]MDY6364294.1 histidine phosphatase family protein [Cyanobacteriota bacterium]